MLGMSMSGYPPLGHGPEGGWVPTPPPTTDTCAVSKQLVRILLESILVICSNGRRSKWVIRYLTSKAPVEFFRPCEKLLLWA